ncbi:MAG: glycosyltransferase family 4 protein [bacterium]
MRTEKHSVLHLSESFGWSGGAAQLLALSAGLSEAGWDVAIACPAGGALWNKARIGKIRVFDFKPFQDYDLRSAWRVSRLIARERFDVVHAHHPKAHAAGLLAVRLSGQRPVFVVSRRVSHPMRINIFSRFKYHNSGIDGYAVVAGSVKKILADYGVPDRKIEVIYSGVDENRFHPMEPDKKIMEELRLPDGIPAVGIIGNFSRDKGQDVFVKAAAEILRSGKKAVFLFAGRDTDSPELKDLAGAAGLAGENTRFLGFREDVPNVLSVMKVSVNAALAGEALSGSIRESMAMEIPVIASDISGNGELVRPGETGALFLPGDWTALSRLLCDFLDHPEKAGEMARNGLDFIKKNLTVGRMVEHTKEYYSRLMSERMNLT